MVCRLLLLIVLFILSASCNDLGTEEEIHGCCDPIACNYNSAANVHDDENDICEYADEYFDCDGLCILDIDQDGICDELEVEGCNDVEACNFNINATENNNSCIYSEIIECDNGNLVCNENDC